MRLVAVPLACLVSATIGVTSLALTHSLTDRGFATAVLVWWCGDVLGGLVVAAVGYRSSPIPGTRMSIALPSMCRLWVATPLVAPPRSWSMLLVSGVR